MRLISVCGAVVLSCYPSTHIRKTQIFSCSAQSLRSHRFFFWFFRIALLWKCLYQCLTKS